VRAEFGAHDRNLAGVDADTHGELAVVTQFALHDLGIAVEPAQPGAVGSVEREADHGAARRQPGLDFGGKLRNPLPAQRRHRHRMPLAPLPLREIAQLRPRVRFKPVDLVPDFDDAGTLARLDPELA
jgi:hypothetical protein